MGVEWRPHSPAKTKSYDGIHLSNLPCTAVDTPKVTSLALIYPMFTSNKPQSSLYAKPMLESSSGKGMIVESDVRSTPGIYSRRVPAVHFPDDSHLVVVIEFEDDAESAEDRKCYWEIFARDRARFRDRIEQISAILNPILNPDYRSKIQETLNRGASELSPLPSDNAESLDINSNSKKRRRKRLKRKGKK